jgi:tetratricopeptide (TPR) repeat protein
MAPPRPTPEQLRSLLAVGAVAMAALAGGWWLGRLQSHGGLESAPPKRAALQQEVSQLRLRLERRDASEEDRQRLLELLVGLERRNEAISLLEPMADREPDRWSLRLMLAELRRAAGDRSGAEREVRQILSRHPDQVEALQLMALLQLEQGQGRAATAMVTTAYQEATTPELQPRALGLGLLLAELQLKRGQSADAQATYLKLAQDFPQDPRPLLALALMLHDQGDSKAALEALQQARRRDPQSGNNQPALDRLAAEWGLRPGNRHGNPAGPTAPSGPTSTSGGPEPPSPRTP